MNDPIDNCFFTFNMAIHVRTENPGVSKMSVCPF